MENIILASASPRRREILEKYKIKHEILKSNIIEKTNSQDRAEVTAMGLAFEKAMDIARANPDKIIIGADTLLVFQGEILGKPKDKEDARRILEKLNGKSHEVITGLSLIHLDSKVKLIDYEITKVNFRQLDQEFINKYVNTNEPLDKAGAYGIQDYGALLVESIEGCYLNVVGLPLVKLDKLLRKYFNYNI